MNVRRLTVIGRIRKGTIHQRRGFSLIEVAIVVLVIGIAAAVAFPRYGDSVMRHRVLLAGERIAADLRVARNQAMSTSRRITVKFDTATHSYTIPGLPDQDHPGRDHFVNLREAPFHVSLVSADFGGTAELSFDPFGMPVGGGSISVGSPDYLSTVTVDAGGRVAVSDPSP